MNSRLWYHPESDSYYIGNYNETDGLAEDVTGVQEHEDKAKERGVTRPATRMEIVEALAEIAKQSFADELTKVVRSCLNCDCFDEPKENCNKYGGRPPAKIIAFGCNGYEEKVPF